MVIPFVVPEILGGVEPPPPQMPLSCQKRQMPLTVKIVPQTEELLEFYQSLFTWDRSGIHFVLLIEAVDSKET